MALGNILKAIIFGIVEGITEWLPVSSTGHMIILNEIIPLDITDEFYSLFQVVIQLGAIMAVVLLYYKRLIPFKKEKNGKIKILNSKVNLWIKIFISCLPAAIIGILFDDILDEIFYNWYTVAISLIVIGILFIVVEKYYVKNKKLKIKEIDDIGIDTAIIIGIAQVIAAIFPGTSRSGITILAALLIGVGRKIACEYTFYLAIPVMFGASLLKLVKYISNYGLKFSGNEIICLIVGMIVAFIVSLFAIVYLLGYIKKNNFELFGYYRIVLGVLVILILGIILQ